MKYLRFLILIFFILFSHSAFAENKIVFIDIDFLMKNSNIGKLSLKKLEKYDFLHFIKKSIFFFTFF